MKVATGSKWIFRCRLAVSLLLPGEWYDARHYARLWCQSAFADAYSGDALRVSGFTLA